MEGTTAGFQPARVPLGEPCVCTQRYVGTPELLSKPARFLWTLSRLPRVVPKLRTMLFVQTFEADVGVVRQVRLLTAVQARGNQSC